MAAISENVRCLCLLLFFWNFLVLAILEPLAFADRDRQLVVGRRTPHHQLRIHVGGFGLVLAHKLELVGVNRQRVAALARHLPNRVGQPNHAASAGLQVIGQFFIDGGLTHPSGGIDLGFFGRLGLGFPLLSGGDGLG